MFFFVHGGAWVRGDRSMYRGIGRMAAQEGWVAVLPGYRLPPRVSLPEYVRDVAWALAWTYRHIREYGEDPQRIVLAGHSVGAQLVALLAAEGR